MARRHQCWNSGPKDWAHCCVCDGRIHREECTTRRDKHRDCCPERHKMLHDQGHTRGLADSSFIMWTPERPYGVHQSEQKS